MITVIFLFMALAGGLGAVARFTLDSFIVARWPGPLPLGTVVINITGSLCLGLLTGFSFRFDGAEVLTVLGIGFLGGYTTFSTASVEAARLIRSERALGAALHAAAMMVLSLAAAIVGLWLTSP